MKTKITEQAESSFSTATSYIKDLLGSSAPGGVAGNGLEIGVGAALSKTLLKRLPVPLNFIAPIIVEKVILKYGVEEGREVLIKGLKWIKKTTDEKEEPKMIL